MNFHDTLLADVALVEQHLDKCMMRYTASDSVVAQAMRYSLSAGGKRIRPVLVLEFARLCGKNPETALPFAAALEMVHTYSLIHDDLPCMDDDDLRRGKPSCHKQFGEANALLAGDGLLTLAFEVLADSELPSAAIVKSVSELSDAAGIRGMIGGQELDLYYEGKSVTESILMQIHSRKTSAMIRAACRLGCIAGEADESLLAIASEYAEKIGLAFQIEDDVLDVCSSEEVLGKPIGSDAENQKTTYVDLLGLEGCKNRIDQLTKEACALLESVPNNNGFLTELAVSLQHRNK